MAGLEGLKNVVKERLEDEPTSSVPTSEYSEKYEPSALKGVAGLALAGAGAVALRTPFGRAINKLSKLATPKTPVSRITEPTDAVDELLTITPTKVDRGRAMTQAQIPIQEQIRQEAIAKSNELKKMAYANPLSRGGKTNRIGSSLWDYIARHPVAGARKATEWINDFKGTGPASFSTKNPEFKNISQAVKRDELWDSNLVQFDKNGNIVGGFLKVAAEKDIPLTKMDLLYIVEKSPVNNLKTRVLTTNVKLVDEAEDITNNVVNSLDDLRGRILANPETMIAGNTNRARKFSDLLKQIEYTKKDARNISARMNNKYRVNTGDSYDEFSQSPYKKVIDDYEGIVNNARELDLAIDANAITAVTATGRAKDLDLFRKLQLQNSQKMMPKYGNYGEYRIKGGDEYFETVTYYPKDLPLGQKLPSGFNSHYSGIPNQVYHVRGNVRKTVDNKKVMMIDEIQSDYNQALRKEDPLRQKVKNAFGSEIEFFSSNRKIEKIVDEMKSIAVKGIKMTKEDAIRFNKLKGDFNEIKTNSLNMANITGEKAKDGIPFLPLYGKENWGSHALKNTIKNAAERGDVEWVAISPVERLHHAKRERYLGDIEFYGNRFGKAGFDNYSVTSKKADKMVKTDPKKIATLPAEMNRLAREYNSEVKTIRVAKSDPDKPYKIVKGVEADKKFKLDKDSAGTEHEAAFRTKEEALAYADRFGRADAVEMMLREDPKLYMDVYAIKISPDMINKPFKAYQEGGLVVNIFA